MAERKYADEARESELGVVVVMKLVYLFAARECTVRQGINEQRTKRISVHRNSSASVVLTMISQLR